MKKTRKYLTFLFALCGLAGLAAGLGARQTEQVSEATTTTPYPWTGTSGTLMFVDGRSTFFNSGEADLVLYCFNSETDFAWSEKYNYRISNDLIRAMIPYKNGESKTWVNYIICRYNPSLNPSVNGWDGVYNQTDNLKFAPPSPPGFMYSQNTITITGYSGSKLTVADIRSSNTYYGLESADGSSMYLDLKDFPQWEEGNAKFAIYFAYPSGGNANGWSLRNTSAAESKQYVASFCWKVLGQDNDHLYECIVPNNANCWNMVIAVRYNGDFSEENFQMDPWGANPSSYGWESSPKWNQTQNLTFNSSNQNSNIIHVDGWDHAELDGSNFIARSSRVGFYGQYFLDTVKCSGGDKSKGQGDATTDEMWNAVKDEYTYHLSSWGQGQAWDSKGDEEGTLIQQAMARYDYIVFKKSYPHEDFMKRAKSGNVTQYRPDFIVDTADKNYIYLYIIIGTISLLAVSSLILVKKLKVKRK